MTNGDMVINKDSNKMEARDVKEYLKEIKYKQRYLGRLQKRRNALHLDVSFGTIDYSVDRIQSTPRNKLEEAAVRLSERLERIDNDIRKVSVEIDDRIGSIEMLSSDIYKSILYKRYVEDKSFEQISTDLQYTYNYTCALHGNALIELSKVLNFS